MIKALMVGGPFQHQNQISINNKPSKNLIWVKNTLDFDIKIFIDESIVNNIGKNKKKCYAWIFESRSIFNRDFIYSNIDKISESYELIFTHDQELLKLGKNFIFVPANTYWIEDATFSNKNKLISFITSDKKETIGHFKRHNLLKKLPSFVDIFGKGVKEIRKKEEGLSDYMFSICIENDKYDNYFTEKILDCFACGTVPIYWGCPSIHNFFDVNGIIILEDNFDFSKITTDLYLSKRSHIQKNLEIVKRLEILEDFIFKFL
jgi:hypothetical protein